MIEEHTNLHNDIEALRLKIYELDGAFDKHMEVYQKNNHALYELVEAVKRIEQKHDDFEKRMRPIQIAFQNSKFLKTFFVTVVSIAGAVVGLALGVKQLFK